MRFRGVSSLRNASAGMVINQYPILWVSPVSLPPSPLKALTKKTPTHPIEPVRGTKTKRVANDGFLKKLVPSKIRKESTNRRPLQGHFYANRVACYIASIYNFRIF